MFCIQALNEEVPWGIALLLTQKAPVDTLKSRSAKNRVFHFKLNRPLYGPQCLFGEASTNAINSKENHKMDVDSICDTHTSDEGFVPILVDKIASAIEKVLHDIFLIKIDSVMCCPLNSEDLNTSDHQGKMSLRGSSSIANSISSEGTSNLKAANASSIPHTSKRPDCKAPIHSTHENSWRPWPILPTIEQSSQKISNSSFLMGGGLDDADNGEITEKDLGLERENIGIQPTSSVIERIFDEVGTSEIKDSEGQTDVLVIESDESEDANMNNSNDNADTEEELWRFHDRDGINFQKVGNENQYHVTLNPFMDLYCGIIYF